MKKIIFFLVPLSVSAATLSPQKSPYEFKMKPEFVAIMEQLKPFGEFAPKTEMTVTPTVKPMSKGQLAVEEAKARNRALLARKNQQDKVEATKNQGMSELDKWKLEDKKTRDGWKQESREILKQWKREQDIFLGRIKVYKENTFELPVKKEVIIEKPVPVEVIPDMHIVNGTFELPIRDQWSRPTCSAFAGLRAIEVLLAQHKRNEDLSEQYFYWASKPKCQTSPCKEKGSWVNTALKYSQSKASLDIPTESQCYYQGSPVDDNETQIPLGANCQTGVAKVSVFTEVRTLAETVEQLKNDTPVIMAAKLSENFYKNSGLVTLTDSSKTSGATLDRHSLGHAFLGVGLIELPLKLKDSEGSYCIVVANSWGKGWGAGGYSCLTEKWLTKYRQPAPFAAVTQVMVQ